jgi:hypothetical protein
MLRSMQCLIIDRSRPRHTAKILRFDPGYLLSTVHIRFAARGSGTLQRAPILERLIARASCSARAADWRAEAFRAIVSEPVPVPPLAAASLYASLGDVPGAWVCLATPVHLVAGMSNVTLSQSGILDLGRAETESLATDFNRVFDDAGVRLLVGRPALLLCVFDRALTVATHDPEEVVGRDPFDFQAAGADARRLHRLMSEMEMWLFGHAVNRARAARSLLPVTSMWLWGGGAPVSALPIALGWTAGRDPLFAAFGAAREFPNEAGGGVVVCAEQPGSTAWPEVEERWLAPAVAALRSGRIRRLELSAADRRFSVGRSQAWRFWRRPRPWWESFAGEGGESLEREGRDSFAGEGGESLEREGRESFAGEGGESLEREGGGSFDGQGGKSHGFQ